jgi:hypothetical protein
MRQRSIISARVASLIAIMVRPCNTNAEAAEKAMQTALASIRDGTYKNMSHAVKELGVPKATLHRRLNGGKSRTEVQEKHQLLTKHEEAVLAK